MRRSARPRVRPVEFWNFEKADYSISHDISYNITQLSHQIIRCEGARSLNGTCDDIGHLKAVGRNTKTRNHEGIKKYTVKSPIAKSKQRTTGGRLRNCKSPVTSVKKSKAPQKEKNSTSIKKQCTAITKAQEVYPKEKTGNESKLVSSGRGHRFHKCNAAAEPNDSGVTDMDISNIHSLASETRNTTQGAEISNICQDSRMAKVLKVRSDNAQLSSLDFNNSYSMKRKPPTFNDILSSTAVSDGDISKVNTTNGKSDNGATGNAFKVPLFAPKKLVKKGCSFQPSLNCIAEGKENEKSRLHDSTLDITPKKNKLLVRSRILDLDLDEAELNESARNQVCAGETDENHLSRRNCTVSRKKLVEQTVIEKKVKKIPKRVSASTKKSQRNNNTQVKEVSRRSTRYKTEKLLEEIPKKASENAKEKKGKDISKKCERNKNEKVEEIPKKASVSENISKINLSSLQRGNLNESQSVRRSSRIRKKPLEFWNFEKAEFKILEDGQVSVIYNKKVDPSETICRTFSRCDLNNSKTPHFRHPALAQKDIKKLQHLSLQQSSATKRKMFSPECNTLNSTADVSDLPPIKRRKSLSRKSLDTTFESPPELMKFETLHFLPWINDDFTCYMARSFCNKNSNIYAGFLFLEVGQMIWVTTKQTTVCVISGQGTLKVLETRTKGTEIVLEEKVQTVVPSGKKLCLKKEGSDTLLKLFLVLQLDSQSTPVQ